MKTLTFYVTRQLLVHVAIVLGGLTLFALAGDLIETAKDAIMLSEDPMATLGRYIILRGPVLMANLLPISALVAGLWTVGTLHRHMELVAILNTGVSPLGFVGMALIGSLPLIVLQFALDDWVSPRVTKELYAWGVGDYRNRLSQGPESGWVWLVSDQDILRMAPITTGSKTYKDVSLFRRDENGLLLERIDAPSARHTAEGLALFKARIRDALDGSLRGVPEYRWQGRVDFDVLETLSWDPKDLSLLQLREVIDNAGYGQRPTEIYRTWFHARLVNALQPWLMVLLSMALLPTFSRTRSIAWLFVSGIVLGFGLFIFAGVTTTMGEAGLLAPWIAAWAPVFALLAIAGRMLLQHELLGVGRRGRQPAA